MPCACAASATSRTKSAYSSTCSTLRLAGERGGSPGALQRRGANAALGRALPVDQVELQLAGDHRVEAVGPQAPRDVGEDGARVEPDRLARLRLAHVEHALRGGHGRPWHRDEGARHRPADSVGVAVVSANAEGVAAVAVHVEHGGAGGEGNARAEDPLEVGGGLALAECHAVQPDHEGIDIACLGMAREEGAPLLGWGRGIHRKLHRIVWPVGMVAGSLTAGRAGRTRSWRAPASDGAARRRRESAGGQRGENVEALRRRRGSPRRGSCRRRARVPTPCPE